MPTLKEIRESQFLTQKELGLKAGLTEETINRMETGKNRPTFKSIKLVAKALKVSPAEIDFPKREL